MLVVVARLEMLVRKAVRSYRLCVCVLFFFGGGGGGGAVGFEHTWVTMSSVT